MIAVIVKGDLLRRLHSIRMSMLGCFNLHLDVLTYPMYPHRVQKREHILSNGQES